MIATNGQPGANAPKIRKYFSADWIDAVTERRLLPMAISLPALYADLLKPLTEVEMCPGEVMLEVDDRLKEIGRLEREVATLERKP